ncbi:MAG: DUF4152 family protein [Thermoproteota archaeon]|nr:DUF4152 family protein [Thermoproteota archaeon]
MVAADSGAALLSNRFKPLLVVAATAVLAEPPYRKASVSIAEPIFAEVERGTQLIVHELELCQKLLRGVKADVVHLDMSLGSICLNDLSPIELSNMKISRKARKNILEILPYVRKISADIKRVYNVDVLAIGKDSVPVRIAELTAGAHAVLYSAEKAIKERKNLLLGLPVKCHLRLVKGAVTLQSLIPSEHDILGCSRDEKEVLEKVEVSEMPNPCARGFRVLKMVPKRPGKRLL